MRRNLKVNILKYTTDAYKVALVLVASPSPFTSRLSTNPPHYITHMSPVLSSAMEPLDKALAERVYNMECELDGVVKRVLELRDRVPTLALNNLDSQIKLLQPTSE